MSDISATLFLQKEQLNSVTFSDLLSKIGPRDSIEIFQDGSVIVHQRGPIKRDIAKSSKLFLHPELQRPHLTAATVLPVDEPYDYSARHSSNRKAANISEKRLGAETAGYAIAMELENPTPSICTRHLYNYWMFTLSNGTEVYTEVGNKDRILMFREVGKDYVYVPKE